MRLRSAQHEVSFRAICVEPLEGRVLMSVAPTDVAVATEPPTVRLIRRPFATIGTSYLFHLAFRSDAGINAATLGNDDVTVTGPNGFSAPAIITRTASFSGGDMLLATCRVAAPGGRFDRSDNGVYTIALSDGGVSDNSGATVPGGPLGTFRVLSRRPPTQVAAPAPALPLPTTATAGALSVSFDRAYAWCDHMPSYEPGERRQYLVLDVTLANHSDSPLEVRLDQAYLSFEEGQVGAPTDAIVLMDATGRPSGVKTVVLRPGERRTVQLRGDNLYPEGHHDERFYVTVVFSANGATAAVRNSSRVLMTT